MLLPTPLPGLETPAALLPMVCWAYELLWSPRQRESDAGARMLKLIYDKYVLQLHWHVRLAAAAAAGLAAPPTPGGAEGAGPTVSSSCGGEGGGSSLFGAIMAFLDSLLQLVEGQLQVCLGKGGQGNGVGLYLIPSGHVGQLRKRHCKQSAHDCGDGQAFGGGLLVVGYW